MAKGIKTTENDNLDNRKDNERSLGLWEERSTQSIANSKFARWKDYDDKVKRKCPFEKLIEIHDHESGER